MGQAFLSNNNRFLFMIVDPFKLEYSPAKI